MTRLRAELSRDVRPATIQSVEPLSLEALAAALALVGGVIVIASLLSGVVERSGIPQVAIFLALGAALGPSGLGALDVGLGSPALQVVATLSLALILFTDALTLNLREVRAHGGLVAMLLGPGTLLAAALFSFLGWWLLDLPPAAAVILGAALASTDPVLLRGLLRRRDLPPGAGLALRLEGGLNDAVLLSIVIVALAFVPMHAEAAGPPREFQRIALDLFLLGPGAGIAIGVAGLATLDLVRRKIGVRRDYESLYSLGIAFTAYAAAESVHGSGFLAAFAAGITIAALDLELCDCFREYGETTAELTLLLTFVLLGASLIWMGLSEIDAGTAAFAGLVLLGRPAVVYAALSGASLDPRARTLIAWFGPRGLSSLLLVLLAVFAGAPGADVLFRVACLVVLLSVVCHGGALIWMGRSTSRTGTTPATTLPSADSDEIQIEHVRTLKSSGAPVVIADVRRDDAWNDAHEMAEDAQRLSPDTAADDARRLGLPSDAWIVLYCT